MTRSLVVEPVSPFSNPTSMVIGANATIGSTAKYLIRLTPIFSGLTLTARVGMSNLIQNEGAAAITITPVGSASFSLPAGSECRLSWDQPQNKHEVQLPSASGGGSGTTDYQYRVMVKVAHGLISGDVGKPLSGFTILDDTSATAWPSGVLTLRVDADVIQVAPPGADVTLSTALLELGDATDIAALGRYFFWDYSAGKYTQTFPKDSTIPEILEVFSIDVTAHTFAARVRKL